MIPTGEGQIRRRTVLGGVVAGVGACAGCTGTDEREGTALSPTATPLSDEISVAGSSTVYPITLEVATRFMDEHPDVSVSVSSTGTGGGFAELFCPGRTAINDASRPISATEADACAANGVEPVEFRVGTDALTVVVNDDADWLSCVTTEELATVWAEGGATTWQEVNESWPDEPIELHGPSTASGTFDYFAASVLGEAAHRTDYAGTEQDNTIIQSVEESKQAIGYVGFAYYAQNRGRVTALAVSDAGRNDCVRPSFETARTGAYEPLSRPLFIYVARAALQRPAVRAFVAFYLDLATTDIVRDVGYVPVSDAVDERNRERFAAAVD